LCTYEKDKYHISQKLQMCWVLSYFSQDMFVSFPSTKQN
jgi:hypothetical protein